MKLTSLTLDQFVENVENVGDVFFSLLAKAPVPPALVANLRRLKKLELLTDEVVLSILAQAPIDPLGIYGAMKKMGVWAFSPIDFTMVQVLAKTKDTIAALMRIDLISNNIIFIALDSKKQLTQLSVIEADSLVSMLATPGITDASILALIKKHMKEAVETGLKNA